MRAHLATKEKVMKHMKIMLYLIGTILVAGCSSMTNDGLNAYNRGNYDRAFQLWTQAAQHGEPVAMNNLGTLYQNVYKNIDKAVDWYTLAARYGETTAQINLQNLGKPVPPADLAGRQQTSDENTAAMLLLKGISGFSSGYNDNSRLKTNCTTTDIGGSVYTRCR